MSLNHDLSVYTPCFNSPTNSRMAAEVLNFPLIVTAKCEINSCIHTNKHLTPNVTVRIMGKTRISQLCKDEYGLTIILGIGFHSFLPQDGDRSIYISQK